MEEQTTPQPVTKTPVSEESATGVTEQKSKWWLWLIIAVAVVVCAGIVIWLLL